MTYRIDIAEAAEAEIDAAYLRFSRHSPEHAGRWHAGLIRSVGSLSEMPKRCPLARESGRFSREIRQLLYTYGQTTYRILFTVLDDAPEDAVVRILHIRSAAQRELGADPEP